MKIDNFWKARNIYCCFNEYNRIYVSFYIVSQTQFITELCSSQMTRDTVENLGPAVVQASQQALRSLRQHDLTDIIVNNILTGIQQICEGNQLDCVAKAWLIQNKVRLLQECKQAHRDQFSRNSLPLNIKYF